MKSRLSSSISVTCFVILITALALNLVLSSKRLSATEDEIKHLTCGLRVLKDGDLSLSLTHPVLMNLLNAVTAAALNDVETPLRFGPPWNQRLTDAYSYWLIWEANRDGALIVEHGRFATMALTFLLALVVYIWSKELFGVRAAILSLGLLVFDPNIIAHGALITTDLGATFFIFLTVYMLWRLAAKPSGVAVVNVGLSLGLALAAKVSSLILLIILPLVYLSPFLLMQATVVRKVKNLAAIILLGFISVWAIHGFSFGQLNQVGLSVPMPEYLRTVIAVLRHEARGHPTFLLGEYSRTGWWYYFPIVFLIKTPLPTLLTILGACIFTNRKISWEKNIFLLGPIVLYSAFCICSSLNMGYRHLLPILPFLYLIGGQLLALTSKWRSIVSVTLVLWLAITAMRTYPNSLSFFNSLTWAAPREIVVGSNIDWGQGLRQLKDFMTSRKIESIFLQYYGSADPNAYGINSLPIVLEPGKPPSKTGYYAISVNEIAGLFDRGEVWRLSWFGKQSPIATVADSILIYNVRSDSS